MELARERDSDSEGNCDDNNEESEPDRDSVMQQYLLYDRFTVAQLKELCRGLGLKVSGNKSDLIVRLLDPQSETSRGRKRRHASAAPAPALQVDQATAAHIRPAFVEFFGGEQELHPLPVAQHHNPFPRHWMELPTDDQDPDCDDSFVEGLVRLRELLHAPAPYYHQELISLLPRFKLANKSVLSAPLSDVAAKTLFSAGKPAPFGRGTETVYDESVRKTHQLSPEDFQILVDGSDSNAWQKLFSDSSQSPLLEHIRQELAPTTSKISAKLYKLLVYSEGGFFRNHTDTQREVDMFATLSVEVPLESECLGGSLHLRHQGRKHVANPGATVDHCVATAFYADCEHEVTPVARGWRVTLIYNLLRAGPSLPPQPDATIKKFVTVVDKMLTEDPEQILGHLLEHKYSLLTLTPAHLKGRDALLFTALHQSDKFDLLLQPVQIEENGTSGSDESAPRSLAKQYIAESEEEFHHILIFPIDPTVPPKGGRHACSYASITKETLQDLGVSFIDRLNDSAVEIARNLTPSGNEGVAAMLLYVHSVLLIRKKKQIKAAGSKPKK